MTVFSARPDLAQGQTRGAVSYLDFIDWRSRNRAFDSLAAYDLRGGFTLTTPSGPQPVSGLRVTSGFFRTLGVTPALGREFLSSEEGRSAPPAVMLSYSAWQSRFGGSADILGRTVTLQSPWLSGAEPHVVIGCCRRIFSSHSQTTRVLGDDQSARPAERAGLSQSAGGDRPARMTLDADGDGGDDVRHRAASSKYPGPIAIRVETRPLRDVVLGNVRPMLLMFLSGAALLLVIACMNVLSLLLARSESRRQEIAVRHALGASAARLVMQFATEAFVLAAIATVFGLVLARWGMQFLTSLLSSDMISRMPYLQEVGLNLRLVSFACAVSLIAALAFALVPLARMAIFEPPAGLNEGTRTSAGMHWRRLGAHLVVAELAIAVVLLVSAGTTRKEPLSPTPRGPRFQHTGARYGVGNPRVGPNPRH